MKSFRRLRIMKRLESGIIALFVLGMFAGCANSSSGNTTDNGTDQSDVIQQDLVQDKGSEDVQTQGEDVTVHEIITDVFEEVQPECTVDADCKDREHGVCETVYCDTEKGVCATKPLADYIACDDGDVCTMHDYCLSGKCNPGFARKCDDNQACTDDTCDPQNGCQYSNKADGAFCDDGNAFTQNDACKAGKCVGVSTLACQTDKDCTWVDGDNKCKGRMICDRQAGKCVLSPKTVIHCLQDPANTCQINQCDPKTGECVLRDATDDSPCEDGLMCTVHDKCKAGACVPGVDKCGACTNDKDCAAFDDGDTCHSAPVCKDGTCVAGAKISCEQTGDGTCGKSVCDPAIGKCKDLYIEDGNTCVTSLCKDAQVCNQGTCVGGTDIVCNDKDPCTTDSCDPEKGCVATAISGCKNCSGDTQCDDSNQCTLDKCIGGACQWTPQDQAMCDDGNPCTENDKCNDKGECLAGTPKACDDNKSCTTDSCDTDTGDCVYTPIAGCENCTNLIDDNNNGWTDCDDPYCKANPACQNIKQGDICANPFLVNNGDAITLAGLGDNNKITMTGDTTSFSDNYQGTCNTQGDGHVQDSVYKMVLGENMRVKVSMDFTGTAQTSPWAVVYIYKDVCGAGNVDGCAAGKQNAAVIDRSLVAGTYYIVVDGEYAETDIGPYTLSMEFSEVPATETDCNNKLDDDLDGKTDCLDDDCAGSPDCVPCNTSADLACGQDLVETPTRSPIERMYKFVAAFDSDVTLKLTPTNAGDAFAITVYEDIQQGCDDIKEVKKGAIGSSLTFPAVANTTYIVKVIASQAGSPEYTLSVDCLAGHEVDCGNGIDEDKNGLTDCEDPACFKDAKCTGGHSGEDCTDPLPINDGNGIGLAENGKTFTYYNTTKDANADLTGGCAAGSAAAGDLVYKLVLDQQASVNFVVTPQGTFEPALYIFKDDCSAGNSLTCVSFQNGKAEVQADMDPGTYFVVVDGASADADKAEGAFRLDVNIVNVVVHENCTNGKDDDGDKLIDCQDPDCFKDAACTLGHNGLDCKDPFVVKKLQPLADGDSFDFWNNTGADQVSDSLTGSCGGAGAGDLLYKFVLDQPLEVTASVTFKGFGHPALYLYKDTCGSADAEVTCKAAANGQTATLDSPLGAGTYYLVVDGAGASDKGFYDLNISAKAAVVPEACCWNTLDDNNDSATDCADDSCKGRPVCTATTCQAAQVLQCGDTITIKNFDKNWTNAVSDFTCGAKSYHGYGGYPEYTVAFDATCDTPVTVTLVSNTHNANDAYDLYVLDGSGACDSTKCQNSAFMDANYSAKVDFQATKGQKFFFTAAMLGLYTDITTATEDELTLTVDCQCKPQPKAGDVVITEVMNNPAGSDTGKEYFEVYNPTDKAIDLDGCRIQGKQGEPEIAIATADDGLHDTLIPSKGYLVFGSSQVVGHILPANGGFYDYEGVKFSLFNTSDVIKVVCNDVVLDELDYSGASSGHSLSLSPDHYNATDNDSMDNWCYTYEDPANLVVSNDKTNFPYNDNGDNYGTPGKDNPSCSPAPKQGEALINEVMPDPNGGIGNVYVEVKNTTGHRISLEGCKVNTLNTVDLVLAGSDDGSHDVIVPANGYIVFGNSDAIKAALPSGGAFYNLAGSLGLDKASDFFGITCGSNVIDSVSYDAGNGWTVKTGDSMFLKSGFDATANDDAANWCTSFTAIQGAYSDGGVNKGTPGADNGECPTTATAGDVIITELMIDPASVDTDKQYIELYNTKDSPIDLAGCTLTAGFGLFNLTDLVLPGNNYMVAGVNAHVGSAVAAGAAFIDVNAAFGLSAKGDTVKLSCAGVTIDVVAYDINKGWTITEGKALNLDPDHYNALDNDDAANWCDSRNEITGNYSNDNDGNGGVLPNYGTPGALNTTCAAGSVPPAVGDVVITEMMPNPNSSDTGREYVEMYNTTGHPITLINCQVISKKGSSATESFTIAPADDGLHDTQVEAKGYFVFGQTDTVKNALPTGTPFYQYGTSIFLTNSSSDWVEVKCGDTMIDRAGYSSNSSGHSNSLDIDHYNATDNDDPAHWCFTPETSPIDASYNTDGHPNYGTPGAQNPSCP